MPSPDTYDVDIFIQNGASSVASYVSGNLTLDIDITEITSSYVVNEVQLVQVDLPVSLQAQKGDPGDTMVYPQELNPATEFGWTVGDAGKVWIPVTGL